MLYALFYISYFHDKKFKINSVVKFGVSQPLGGHSVPEEIAQVERCNSLDAGSSLHISCLPAGCQLLAKVNCAEQQSLVLFMCPMHSEAKQKHQSLEQRKVYCRAKQGDRWLVPSKPQTPRSVLAKQGEGGMWLVLANFLMQESIVLVAGHIGQVTMFL